MNRNDPRLTAYVLGELNEQERLEIEAAIQDSPELKSEVEEIQAAAGMLEEVFSAGSSLSLNPQQLDAIEAAVDSGGSHAEKLFSGFPWIKIAALLLLLVGVPFLVIKIGPALRPDPLELQELTELNRPQSRTEEVPDDPTAVRLNSEMDADPAGVPASSGESGPQNQTTLVDGSTAKRQSEQEMSAAISDRDRGGSSEVQTTGRGADPVAQPVEVDAAVILPSPPLPPPPPSRPALAEAGGSGPPIQGREEFRLVKTKSEYLVGLASSSIIDRSDEQLRSREHFQTEGYDRITSNDFKRVLENPLSTFSIDVDTASYSNVRRFLREGSLPPPDAVRIEEMINYYNYEYPQPIDGNPFSVNVESASAPWKPEHRLLRIGLKGRELQGERPSSNLVFLLDVSGSMSPANKLPLLQQAMKLLVDRMRPQDRVAIVVYAGASGLVLPSTSGSQKSQIVEALDRLQAGGSTNGAAGIELAYSVAISNRIEGGTNRVILATDGDFNVGVTDRGSLTRMIEEKAKQGVFLSVLGFGMGNLKDSSLEQLADKGNGNYGYIDTIREARKLLVEQMDGTLVTIAKDVKIQVEFNPSRVAAYRLIGYENRTLANQDFNDDKKDAGEIGAGHTVTALYEIVPVGGAISTPGVDPLKYQQPVRSLSNAAQSGELVTVKLRYKQPEGETSQLLSVPFTDAGGDLSAASRDFKFAAAVASFGMILRKSPYQGNASFASVLELARESGTIDSQGYRSEFLELVEAARRASGQ